MIHIIVDNPAELGFIKSSFKSKVKCVKPMFKNKYGKIQATYELTDEAKKLINSGVEALNLGNEFKI